jgi:hypothetical protein
MESCNQMTNLRPIAILACLLAGCSAPMQQPPPSALPEGHGHTPLLNFSAPVQVNRDMQEGFEPSMSIGPDGTLYVAMSRGFLAGADGSVASPVYSSKDSGTTWTRLASTVGVREKVKTEEGALAIDADGTVYFADTHGADNAFTVWNKDGSWRSTTPLQGTLGADDRPWLAAQGKGIVYYVGNSALAIPAPADAAPTQGSKIWFYVSTDAGTTWSLGHAFPGADYCHIAASPTDDVTVAAVCTPGGIGIAPNVGVTAYWSHDRGKNWNTADLGALGAVPSMDFPSVSFASDGTAAAAWAVDAGAKMMMATYQDDSWHVVPAPATNGTIGPPWVAAGRGGALGVAAYEHEGNQWYLHAWAGNASGWRTWRDPIAVGQDTTPPKDFLQTAMDAQNFLHIAYQRDTSVRPAGAGLNPYLQPIFHAVQLP